MKKHCCKELAAKLGKGDSYPKPAYVSSEDWRRNGHLGWWYPGADGPGYYFIHQLDETVDLSTPNGVITVPALEYRRMEACPYCDDRKSRPVGRPPAREPKVAIHVTIMPDQLEYWEWMGNGNISEGARRITEEHRRRKK